MGVGKSFLKEVMTGWDLKEEKLIKPRGKGFLEEETTYTKTLWE